MKHYDHDFQLLVYVQISNQFHLDLHGHFLTKNHRYFGDDYPVNTIVGAEFPTANVLIEIDAIAVLA